MIHELDRIVLMAPMPAERLEAVTLERWFMATPTARPSRSRDSH